MIVSLMFVFSGNFLIRNWTIALCRSSAKQVSFDWWQYRIFSTD